MNQAQALKKNFVSLCKNGETAELYNFRNKQMQHYSAAGSSNEVSAFLPSDELYLGLFEDYRHKGLSNFDSLMSVYQFEFREC